MHIKIDGDTDNEQKYTNIHIYQLMRILFVFNGRNNKKNYY
jgi:hypothetical protein